LILDPPGETGLPEAGGPIRGTAGQVGERVDAGPWPMCHRVWVPPPARPVPATVVTWKVPPTPGSCRSTSSKRTRYLVNRIPMEAIAGQDAREPPTPFEEAEAKLYHAQRVILPAEKIPGVERRRVSSSRAGIHPPRRGGTDIATWSFPTKGAGAQGRNQPGSQLVDLLNQVRNRPVYPGRAPMPPLSRRDPPPGRRPGRAVPPPRPGPGGLRGRRPAPRH